MIPPLIGWLDIERLVLMRFLPTVCEDLSHYFFQRILLEDSLDGSQHASMNHASSYHFSLLCLIGPFFTICF
jgi:hypothetical protein